MESEKLEKTRLHKIADVKASIEKARKKGKKIIYDNVVIATMSNLVVSRRIAQEYVDVALYQLGIDRMKLPQT